MIKGTNYKIAFSHLTSRVKQGLVATLSVTFGISMYIFMNGFMTGVNDMQNDLAFSALAHVQIYNDLPEDRSDLLSHRYAANTTLVNIRHPKTIQYTQGITNQEGVINSFAHIEGIKHITTQVSVNVFFRNGSTKVNGVLTGSNAKKEDAMFGTSESMKKGSWEEIDHRSDGIVLGAGLARKLSLKMNDNVVVSTADGIDRTFKIIGILETTVAGIDDSKGFVTRGAARQMISVNSSYASVILINVEDYEEAETIARKIDPFVDYKVESWSEGNGQLQAGSDLRNYIAIAVSLTILLVAGFGIYNIMNMTVNEKIKEIAILKAMGFEGRDIVEIFLTQSVVIGLFGGIAGMIFGTIISYAVNHIPFEVASLETLPMAYRLQDYLSAFGFGLLTTFIAGYLPAYKASQVDPVAIIRG